MTRRRGFTLIELLIVVAIIGIIVAIVALNYFNAIQRARQKRSMGDLKTLAMAIESYATDHSSYPAAAGFVLPSGLSLPTATIGTMPAQLSPTYVRVAPLVDGWQSYFAYATSSAQTDYALCSAGADGLLETDPVWGPTTNFAADIIFVDGAFVQFPEGAQR